MERNASLTGRMVAVVLAAAVAGLFFAPVFGLRALLLPVGVPAAVVLAVSVACTRRRGLVDWRPLLATLAGLLAVAETLLFGTTAAGLPTGRTLQALADGAIHSWQLVLQSTWPARPDADLLILVPLLVVVAAVLGAEVLLRLRAPLPALLPSLAVVVLSQLYAALTPGPAAVAALAYAIVAGTALAARVTVLRGAGAVAVSVLIAGLTLNLLPADPARYSLQDGQSVPLPEIPPDNPLDTIGERLAHPGAEVFRVEKTSAVDRWPLVVLDSFDGVSWTADWDYQRLGTGIRPGPAVTVPAERKSAEFNVTGTGGPWLPSQTWPAAVEGTAPYISERYGSLLQRGSEGSAHYRLSWWQPETSPVTLGDAQIDKDALGGLGPVGEVPDGVQPLVLKAMRGLLPSFRSALLLEDFLRENYAGATGQNLPTGHGWPQLADFLLHTKRGTSEQFAAAYVAMARMAGIPARLAVGFRMPAQSTADRMVVVRNGDVLAWPEVAVLGVGWVPLDPIKAAEGATAGTGLAGQAEKARDQLPPPSELVDPPISPAAASVSAGRESVVPWLALLAVPLVPLVGWPVGVPLAWTLRSWRRRRRAGVLDAWAEVRDRLRAYGVPVTSAMTVREVGDAAAKVTDAATADEIRRLAAAVDRTLWAGAPADDGAWESVVVVRRGLARLGFSPRLRALLDPRPLAPVSARSPRRGSP